MRLRSPRKPASALRKRRQACSNRPDSDGLPHLLSPPSHTKPGPTSSSTQISLSTKLSNGRFTTQSADRPPLHASGFSTDTLGGWGDSARNFVTWISQRPSTTSFCAPSDINLELAQRISSSLHSDSARAILRRVRLASRDANTTLLPDDWWPAWEDPDSDAWSTKCDSLPELSDDESLTTTRVT